MGLLSFLFGGGSEAERYPDVENSKRRVDEICRKHGFSGEQELCERAERGGLDAKQYRDKSGR
jgi:hypothetical protein